MDDLITSEPYIEEIGHFEELPPEVEVHEIDTHHSIKERQKREVFFQADIDRCCGDQICVCHKSCPDVPKCSVEEVAIEVEEGQGIPGNCCSTYECVRKVTCTTGVKQSWWKNKCIKCSCFGDNEICEQLCAEEEVIQNCYSEYWHKPMMNGVSWKEGGCTSCTCEQGERSCLTPVCPKLHCKKTITIEDECCAKCVEEESNEEFEEDEYKVPALETTTSKDHSVNKTITLVSTNAESSTVSQLVSTTEAKTSTTLIDKLQATELEGIKENVATQSTMPAFNNTTTTPVLITEFSSTVSPIESSTEAKTSTVPISGTHATNYEGIVQNTTTQSTLVSVVNAISTPISIKEFSTTLSSTISAIEYSTEANNATTLDESSTFSDYYRVTTTETAPIAESTTTQEDENKTLSPMEDSSLANVVTEELVKSSTSSSTSPTTTSSPLVEVTISSIQSSAEPPNTTDTTITTSTEEALSNLTNEHESSTIEISSSEAFSSTIPTIINTTEKEEMPTIVNLAKSTIENVQPGISEETASEEITTIFPAQEVATSSSTSSTTTDATTSSKLPEPTTSATSHTTPTLATDSTTPEQISSTNVPKSLSKLSTTQNPIDSVSTTTSTTTSTTSSPYTTTILSNPTIASSTEEGSSSSTTSAPAPVESFFQSYGDKATVETQQQMRGIFDKIDYVVMIVLFIGALLCIALGLIIRHTKNRKKMYSSIPNSETSLSQTSTNTMMTV